MKRRRTSDRVTILMIHRTEPSHDLNPATHV